MHKQQEKIHDKVETISVTLQNLTARNYSHGMLQGHSELNKLLISSG